MSYQSQVQMASSQSLIARIGACAASEGEDVPMQWAQQNVWSLVVQEGWDEAWAYAEATRTVNQNPDTGARDDVINDGMILAAVQVARGTA